MKGVPIRLEIGPRDIENGQCVLARRDTGEKVQAALEGIAEAVRTLLDEIQQNLFDRALKMREEKHRPQWIWTSLRKTLKKTQALSKPCGVRTASAKTKSRTKPAPVSAAFHSTMSRK